MDAQAANITSITSMANISASDFMKLDGMIFKNSTKGTQGAYIRPVDENGNYSETDTGNYAIFQGDPSVNRNYDDPDYAGPPKPEVISPLPKDKTLMRNEIFNKFGINNDKGDQNDYGDPQHIALSQWIAEGKDPKDFVYKP